jgi:hypothetical protein
MHQQLMSQVAPAGLLPPPGLEIQRVIPKDEPAGAQLGEIQRKLASRQRQGLACP